MSVRLLLGDCRDELDSLPDNSIDACVTDPPYDLTAGKKGGKGTASINLDTPYGRARIGTGNGNGGFMGMAWDSTGVAFDPETWRKVYRVLKPGAWLLAFGGTRTQHRMTCAIEDAGFEIRDQIFWVFGSGFPKSKDVPMAIDQALGKEGDWVQEDHPGRPGVRRRPETHSHFGQADYGEEGSERHVYVPCTEEARAWMGWGTALKPALEPIVVARKPLIGTVGSNVLAFGTGGLNIDACRIPIDPEVDDSRLGGQGSWSSDKMAKNVYAGGYAGERVGSSPLGRWPANLIHDGSVEVLDCFPDTAPSRQGKPRGSAEPGAGWGMTQTGAEYNDAGSAARFFYCAKASRADRGEGNHHPTVKPTELMRYLVKLVTPPGGTVLDLFMGSGSTGRGARLGGFDFIGIEGEADYLEIARRRIAETDPFGDMEAPEVQKAGPDKPKAVQPDLFDPA